MNIRSRLTLWYTLVLGFLLLGFSTGVDLLLRKQLFSEIDRELRADIEQTEEQITNSKNVLTGIKKEEQGLRAKDRFGMEVYENRLLVYSSRLNRKPIEDFKSDLCKIKRHESLTWKTVDGISLRISCKSKELLGKNYVIISARSAERIERVLADLFLALLWMIPLAIGIAALGGYWLARRALHPVSQMTKNAEKITAEKLSDRLPVINPKDELGKLASAFNKTFERLEKSFEQMKRFSADASHELRTPLTVIRTLGEVALNSKEENSLKEALSSILEETDRLRGLCENLLVLSRADSGQIKIHYKKTDLKKLCETIVENLGVLAEEKEQKLELIAPTSITRDIDPTLFSQAIVNLVDNAIRYTPNKGLVLVEVTDNNDKAVIEVKDQGPGIDEVHQKKIFDRFFRIDDSRNRNHGGAGLGLAISKWAVEIHGGKIRVQSTLGKGSIFRIELPHECR